MAECGLVGLIAAWAASSLFPGLGLGAVGDDLPGQVGRLGQQILDQGADGVRSKASPAEPSARRPQAVEGEAAPTAWNIEPAPRRAATSWRPRQMIRSTATVERLQVGDLGDWLPAPRPRSGEPPGPPGVRAFHGRQDIRQQGRQGRRAGTVALDQRLDAVTAARRGGPARRSRRAACRPAVGREPFGRPLGSCRRAPRTASQRASKPGNALAAS